MALFTVVHKTSFQGRFHPGHHRFVNIAFALLSAFDFNFVVEKLLSIHDGQTTFFRLRGIDQHAFHFSSFQGHNSPTTQALKG